MFVIGKGRYCTGSYRSKRIIRLVKVVLVV